MDSFQFKKNIDVGKAASASLSEQMALKGDHIVLQWLTEYQGKDLSSISKKMRSVKPQFSDDRKF